MSFILSSHLAPASIEAALAGGTTSDWNPTGWTTATIIWISASSPSTLNGLAGGVDGRVAFLILRQGSSDVTLSNDTGGTAANRFGTLASGTLSLTGTIGRSLQYDGGTSRWRPFSL